MNRTDARVWLIQIAPPAPPCFADRAMWLEWLKSAFDGYDAVAGNPLLVTKGVVSFNTALNFCGDCHIPFAIKMRAAARCRPSTLKDGSNIESPHADHHTI